MGKKKTEKQVVVEKILEKRNKSLADWKKEALDKAQFDFFKGQDADLEAYALDRAMDQLILNECKKNN
ncbi:hypothetical protein IET03_002076 [Enterococcus faecalis]|nr:hypothetical protein [Enterococcus faecalis]